MNKLVIIDGNAIVHRAYHAIPPLTTKNGKMVNAVYGFTSMMLKVIKDIKPTHVAVTFDLAGPTFRHKNLRPTKPRGLKPIRNFMTKFRCAMKWLKLLIFLFMNKPAMRPTTPLAQL